MRLDRNDLGSRLQAVVCDVLEPVTVLRQDLCHAFAGVAGIRFKHDARAKFTKNPAGAAQYNIFEAFHINLQEVGLDI
jgi:hypothetical protein